MLAVVVSRQLAQKHFARGTNESITPNQALKILLKKTTEIKG